ncbi:MAG: AI-2E family transporter [Phycisphaerales bacterium]|nr:AI-2E family transporter [Phycisphaerales bacterium]
MPEGIDPTSNPDQRPMPPASPEPAPAAKPGAMDWRAVHLWQIQPLRDAALVLVVLGLVWLGYKLSLVTVPLLLALLLAYLFEPLVSWLTSLGRKPGREYGYFTRPFAAVGIIVAAFVIVVVPVVGGLGFGLLQGAGYVQQQASHIQALWRSVENPEDQRMVRALPGGDDGNWFKLRQWLIDLRAEATRASKRAAMMQGESSPAPTDPTNPDKKPEPTSVVGAVLGPALHTLPHDPPDGYLSPWEVDPQFVGPPERAESFVPRLPSAQPTDPADAMMSAEDEAHVTNPTAVFVYETVEWLAKTIKNNSRQLSQAFVQTGAGALTIGFGLASSLAMLGFGAFITAFFFFYISTNFDRVLRFLRNLIPDANRDETVRLVGLMDNAISGFIRGRLTICAILVVYFTIMYTLIGVGLPLILGPVVGLLCLVPYASSLGIPVAMLLLLLQPGWVWWQETFWWIVLAPIAVHSLAQVLDDYVLSPKIQGKNTGMDTPTILFASLAGGILAGFYGLLIAIPVAACVKILMQEVFWPRFRAWREGRVADPLPVGKR